MTSRRPAPTPAPTGTATTTTVAVPTVDAAAQPLKPASAGAPIPDPAALAARCSRPWSPTRPCGPGRASSCATPSRARPSHKAASTARASRLDRQAADGARGRHHARPAGHPPTTRGPGPPAERDRAGRRRRHPCWPRARAHPRRSRGGPGWATWPARSPRRCRRRGPPRSRSRLDTTYARGPRWAPGWSQADVDAGLTGGVVDAGPGRAAAVPFKPAPRDPEAATGAAFVAALAKVGITATLAPEPPGPRRCPAGAAELGPGGVGARSATSSPSPWTTATTHSPRAWPGRRP